MVIFKYELKNHRKYILSWTITLAICIFIMIPIYYSLLGDVYKRQSKTLCKHSLTLTSGSMGMLRAVPLKQSRRRAIPTATGNLISRRSRNTPPTTL